MHPSSLQTQTHSLLTLGAFPPIDRTQHLNSCKPAETVSCLARSIEQKPGLFAVIQQAKPFLQRAFLPDGVEKDSISSEHVNEALGDGWEGTLGRSGGKGRGVTPHEEEDARKMQRKVMRHVADELLERGLLTPYKGLALSTLVYACALEPRAPIVKLLLKRLRAEDEDDEGVLGLQLSTQAVRKQIDLTARAAPQTLVQTLGQLFGLSVGAQNSEGLAEKLLTLGVVNKVKTYGVMLARQDIVVALVRSLATRAHVENCESALEGATGVLGVVHDLVSEQDAVDFSRNEDGALGRLEEYAADSWSRYTDALAAKWVANASLRSINKQAIKRSLGTAEAEGNKKTKEFSSDDYRRSNKSMLDPGYGRLPHIAVTAVPIVFDAQALSVWHQHEDNPPRADDPTKGKRARALASEFAALVVERSIARFCVGEDARRARALAKFARLVGALDRDGLLFEILREDPRALGPSFFDEARLKLVKEVLPEAGDSDEAGEADEG